MESGNGWLGLLLTPPRFFLAIQVRRRHRRPAARPCFCALVCVTRCLGLLGASACRSLTPPHGSAIRFDHALAATLRRRRPRVLRSFGPTDSSAFGRPLGAFLVRARTHTHFPYATPSAAVHPLLSPLPAANLLPCEEPDQKLGQQTPSPKLRLWRAKLYIPQHLSTHNTLRGRGVLSTAVQRLPFLLHQLYTRHPSGDKTGKRATSDDVTGQ